MLTSGAFKNICSGFLFHHADLLQLLLAQASHYTGCSQLLHIFSPKGGHAQICSREDRLRGGFVLPFVLCLHTAYWMNIGVVSMLRR